jgi:two-component system sensor histidine kinase DegS
MAASRIQPEEIGNAWQALSDLVVAEIEQAQRELTEIDLTLEQSQGDVDKLTQRNATITTHLQQIKAQIEEIPKDDVRAAYEAALDAQQRLVLMRSQVERLQSEKKHLEGTLSSLNKVKEALEKGPSATAKEGSDAFDIAEMMIQSQEAERQRLSRQMHDGPAQALSNFILQTEIAMRLFDVDQEKARQELSTLRNSASSTFQQVRDFITDLRPMMLDDLGLVPTLRHYAEAFGEKSGIDVNLSVSGGEIHLEPYLEVMLFRSVQELLNNVALREQANQISVKVEPADALINVSVESNGTGFDTEMVDSGEAGVGIKLIKERVEMLGGEFKADSVIGQGGKIAFSVPVEK